MHAPRPFRMTDARGRSLRASSPGTHALRRPPWPRACAAPPCAAPKAQDTARPYAAPRACNPNTQPAPAAWAAHHAQRAELTTPCDRTPRPRCTGFWPTCAGVPGVRAQQALVPAGHSTVVMCLLCVFNMSSVSRVQETLSHALTGAAQAGLALGGQPCTAHTSMQDDVVTHVLCPQR